MALLDYLRDLFASDNETSEPEQDELPEGLGPSARQHAYRGDLPERYKENAEDEVDMYITVNTDIEGAMDNVEDLLKQVNMRTFTRDDENGVFTIERLPRNPHPLVRLAESEYVEQVYYAREWSNE